jgi:hypothetical protein
VWDRWEVQDATIGDGDLVLFEFTPRRVYAPLEDLKLPNALAAAARDEATLLQFLLRYGRLGWHELTNTNPESESDEWILKVRASKSVLGSKYGMSIFYAEPLEWIQAHGRTVAWCLNAAETLNISRTAQRIKRCQALIENLPRPAGIQGTLKGLGDSLSAEAIAAIPPVDLVGSLLCECLQKNLNNVGRHLHYVGNGRLQSYWGGSSLIESIYTLVADAITGGRLARCEASDCGAVFVQTDSRERFCPPWQGESKSRCMNRERVRQARKRKKEEEQRGKATRKR